MMIVLPAAKVMTFPILFLILFPSYIVHLAVSAKNATSRSPSDGTTEYPASEENSGFLSSRSGDFNEEITIDEPIKIRRTLRACLLIERGSDDLLYNYDKAAGAMALALQYSNEQLLNPLGINLVTTYYDIGSTCAARNHIVAIAMYLINQKIRCNVYIGVGKAQSHFF